MVFSPKAGELRGEGPGLLAKGGRAPGGGGKFKISTTKRRPGVL